MMRSASEGQEKVALGLTKGLGVAGSSLRWCTGAAAGRGVCGTRPGAELGSHKGPLSAWATVSLGRAALSSARSPGAGASEVPSEYLLSSYLLCVCPWDAKER